MASASSSPMNSSRLRGRIRSASGAEGVLVRRTLAGASLCLDEPWCDCDVLRFLSPLNGTCGAWPCPDVPAALPVSGGSEVTRQELRWSLISALATCLEHTGHGTKADADGRESCADAIEAATGLPKL